MKKWGILIGGLIAVNAFTAYAQTDMSSLFSSDSPNIIYENKPKNYTGSPLVFIEGISDQPQPQGWMDEMKIKLFGSMDLPKQQKQNPLPPLKEQNIQQGIKFRSLFGKEKNVAFVPHTSDWNFIIQVLNDEEIFVQEDIQFIKTKETPPLARDWQKQNMNLLDVQINGHPITPQLREEQGILKLKLPDLDTGLHTLHLSYLIRNSGQFSKKSAKINLSLTDMGWRLPAASLMGTILFPKQINESELTFLFGKNKQKIPEAFKIEKDNLGALFFQSTHLIPASAPIQFELDLKFDSFIQKGLFDKLFESTSFLIFLVALIVILGYLILNIIEIKITPVEEIMHKHPDISANFFKSFWNRTKEIWVGLFLLWGGTFVVLNIMKEDMLGIEIQILFLIPIVFVLGIDYLLLYPRQEKIRNLRGIK